MTTAERIAEIRARLDRFYKFHHTAGEDIPFLLDEMERCFMTQYAWYSPDLNVRRG